MKLFFTTLVICSFLSSVVHAEGYPVYPAEPSFPGMSGGMYGGLGMGKAPGMNGGIGGYTGGGYPSGISFQTPNGMSAPVYDSGLPSSSTVGSQYQTVKADSRCPLLTISGKADQDIFTDLRNFLSTAASNPKCGLRPDMTPGSPNISMLENMLGSDSASMGNVKCYSQNVELIGQRNLAYYYAEKEMTQNDGSIFSACLNPPMQDPNFSFGTPMPAPVEAPTISPLDKKRECISKKYEDTVELNKTICHEMTVPKEVQKQVNQGLVGLESLLSKAIASKEDCGFNSQALFKVTMNTFLKAKSLSVVGPWGALAGMGADLVGTLLDKLIPSDEQQASNLMNEIVSEDTFEQNACLYFNIQQKMYCEDRPVEILPPSPGCQAILVGDDLMKLLQKFKDVKKVTDTYAQPQTGTLPYGPQGLVWPGQQGDPSSMASATPAISPELEAGLLEHLDDLSQFAVSSETDLRNRVKSLPKIIQAREQIKIDAFLNKMKEYQAYDPAKDVSGTDGKKLVTEISQFFTNKNPDNQLDLSMFVLKTTPGTKMEAIKQRSIARTIEQLMTIKDQSQGTNESSRTMAKYNKYKTAMAKIAKDKFESRLDKQYQDFQKQVKFVSSRDKGVVNDPVAEGQLRNLVRHCGLLQEIYDPNLDGSLPSVCKKLSCGDKNTYGLVFKPQKDKANYSDFKQNYCDKTLSLPKIEGDYVKDLKDASGAKICGVKAENFF